MHNSRQSNRQCRALLACLLALLMLASLCFAAGAVKNEELLLTLDPNEMNSLKGSTDDFSWSAGGNGYGLSEMNSDTYSGNAIRIAKANFTISDTNAILDDYSTVVISADVYFSAFPSKTYTTTDGTGASITYSCDPNSDLPFRSQSLLAWVGSTNSSTYYDGIRIDSEGNLYSGISLSTAIDAKLETNTWYNLKLIHSSVSNSAEIWLNGERVGVGNCLFREFSSSVRFFDGTYSYESYIKNINISASESIYYTGIVKEESSDFISYQTTKPETDGSFKLRIIAGVNSLDYESFGYRVLVLTKDGNGNAVSKELTGTDHKAYSSIFGGNTRYSIEEMFGYQYACLATIENLDQNSAFTELVIFPYTLSPSGNKLYGTPISLVYTGAADDEGYPLFVRNNTVHANVTPTDDCGIYYGTGYTNDSFGTDTYLMVRNTGNESAELYRAAYFKFTVPKETVDQLDSLANSFLHLNIRGYESNEARQKYPLVLYSATNGWDESTLTYNTRATVTRGDEVGRIAGEDCAGYIKFDILDYLRAQPKNSDGSITASFCLTQEDGHEDTRMLYVYTKESGESSTPYISFEETLYGHSISNVKSSNEGYEPLSYAEALVNTWFDELYPAMYLDENGNPLYHDELGNFAPEGYAATEKTGDYTYELTWKNGTPWYSKPTENPLDEFILPESKWNTDRFARTLSTLGTSAANKYLASAYADHTPTYDAYGGITNAGFTGTATGYFHTEKHTDGRTYIIDPLGNPYFAISVNTLGYGTGDTQNQRNYILDTYETAENFFTEISADLRDIGVNTAFVSSSDSLLAVKENGLAVTVSAIGIGDYMGKLGRSQVSEGVFPNNNTINVFDPDLVKHLNQRNYEFITENGYAEMDNLFAYTSDNELPSGKTILERYLTVDPTIPENIFSYHTAWTWLARRLDMVNPTIYDLRALPTEEYDAINSEFLGFVYAQYYKTVSESIKAVDPNHMYIGSRVNGNCPYDEGYLRAAGYYLDIIAINLYGGLNPLKETVSGIYYYSGKPFIVTEFFAKGLDTIDANGYPLATSTGAGILVYTQEDRAAYYEHYVLNLLEAKSCVGWVWYRFRDNDQSLWSFTAEDGTVYENIRMLSMTYGENPVPNSLMLEDGTKVWLSDIYSGDPLEWSTVFTKTYSGEGLASNQNINKGFYNNNFSSTVTVYYYNADGSLDLTTNPDFFGSRSYEVVDPSTDHPADGTVLTSKDGKTTYTIGKAENADGSYTVTVLSTYKGRYVALTDSIKSISDNIIGIIDYLDNGEHK